MVVTCCRMVAVFANHALDLELVLADLTANMVRDSRLWGLDGPLRLGRQEKQSVRDAARPGEVRGEERTKDRGVISG